MNKKIIVAGAGHGGIIAAYFLAQNGYTVTVYEKNSKDELGYEQNDSVHIEDFEKVGIPYPEEYYVKRTPIAFCIPCSDLEPIVQADSENSYHLFIDRKGLYKYLISLAEEAGVKFIFDCEITAPVILGSRVVGIETADGTVYGDLIIDSCGVNSPIRTNLPDFMNIQQNIGKYDVLKAYRAYFNKKDGMEEPDLKYKLSLIAEEDFQGLSWVITKGDYTDILIGGFNSLSKENIEKYLNMQKEENPIIGDTLIRGGKITDIPVRQPLAVLVADGYAAIGDSAFMTIPLKGSGIGYCLRAGKILADAMIEDENGLYNRETLWKYQTEFFDQIGSGAAIMGILKSNFPQITKEDLEYVFTEKVVTSEDMEILGSESGAIKIITNLKFGKLKDKAKKIVGHTNVRKMLLGIGKNVGMYMLIEKNLHDKYDSSSVAKWAEVYNSFFENLYED